MKTNADFTIYNHYIEGGVDKWHRTYLGRCKWEDRKAANVLRSGLLDADSVAVYMPFIKAPTPVYVTPVAWQALTNWDNLFTFQKGDFIVRCNISQEITPEFPISKLKAAYDSVVKITSVDRMDAGSARMHHWQIGAS